MKWEVCGDVGVQQGVGECMRIGDVDLTCITASYTATITYRWFSIQESVFVMGKVPKANCTIKSTNPGYK